LIVSCDNQFRVVNIAIEASELEKDWGSENRIIQYWPDELEIIK